MEKTHKRYGVSATKDLRERSTNIESYMVSTVHYDASNAMEYTGPDGSTIETGGTSIAEGVLQNRDVSIDLQGLPAVSNTILTTGNVVGLLIDDSKEPTVYRINEISHKSQEPKKVFMTSVDNESVILTRVNSGKYLVENKSPSGTTVTDGIHDINFIMIPDDLLLSELGESQLIMAQKL